MSRNKKEMEINDLREEYRPENLGTGIRGKYLRAYEKGSNLVLLSPDVAEAFPTSESVNEALRSLLELARKSARVKKKSTVTRKRASR